MATQHSRIAARLMISPAVILLFLWMIVPLAMTLYFSFLRYNLLMPGMEEWAGFSNYSYFLTDPAFFTALRNTLVLVLGVLLITVIGGVLLALLLDQPMWGQGIVRILVIAPFFVMPRPGRAVAISRARPSRYSGSARRCRRCGDTCEASSSTPSASSMLRPWSTKREPWSKPAEYIVTRPSAARQPMASASHRS